MNVALFYNREKFVEKESLLLDFIKENSRFFSFYLEDNSINPELPLISNYSVEFDYIFAIGGDGTMLSTIGKMAFKSAKYVGIKLGNLGFLSCTEFETFSEFVPLLLDNKIQFEESLFLKVEILQKDRVIDIGYALNDVVIEREDIARMMNSQVSVNGTKFAKYTSNGLIVSTPTGSTAYNLSAGGPIVYKGVSCMVLTPICSHSLGQRPVVFGNNTQLEINNFGSRSSIALTLDGQRQIKLNRDSRVIVSLSDSTIKIVRPKDYEFSSFLNTKLNWNN